MHYVLFVELIALLPTVQYLTPAVELGITHPRVLPHVLLGS